PKRSVFADPPRASKSGSRPLTELSLFSVFNPVNPIALRQAAANPIKIFLRPMAKRPRAGVCFARHMRPAFFHKSVDLLRAAFPAKAARKLARSLAQTRQALIVGDECTQLLRGVFCVANGHEPGIFVMHKQLRDVWVFARKNCASCSEVQK